MCMAIVKNGTSECNTEGVLSLTCLQQDIANGKAQNPMDMPKPKTKEKKERQGESVPNTWRLVSPLGDYFYESALEE